MGNENSQRVIPLDECEKIIGPDLKNIKECYGERVNIEY